jgi:hypothetical protein
MGGQIPKSSRTRRLFRGLLVVIVAIAAWSGACAGTTPAPKTAADLSPISLYPLRVGGAWSYDVDSGDGEPVLAVARVTQVVGEVVEVSTGAGSPLGYVLRDESIARVGGEGYLLKQPMVQGASWMSGRDTTAEVVALGLEVKVPAGEFRDCVRVQEQNAGSGQRVTTTYCPGVGPVQVVSEMQVRGQNLRVDAKLRGYAQ